MQTTMQTTHGFKPPWSCVYSREGFGSLYVQGATMFTAVTFAVSIKLAIRMQFWTTIHIIVLVGSVAFFFLSATIVAQSPQVQ
jgi:hypothetical protein